jgi:hypothetical protein
MGASVGCESHAPFELHVFMPQFIDKHALLMMSGLVVSNLGSHRFLLELQEVR